MDQTQNTTRSRQETPGERADKLAALGYTLRRTDTLGVYLLTKPDGSRTYRVDVPGDHCGCQSTAWHGCKHLLYAARYAAYDLAKVRLAEAYRRGVLLHECEDDLYAAGSVLMDVAGLELWDEMRGLVNRCRRAVVVEMGRAA